MALVTWMIFWMRRTARRLEGDLTGKLEAAIGVGVLAVAGIAFVSVIREGLETALLFSAAAQGASSTSTPLVAISLGLLTAILLGFGLYAGAIRVDLQEFSTVSGVLLVLVAAGILKYGVRDFQEADVLPGLDVIAFDISGVLDPDSWYGAAIAGMSNITAAPTVLEMTAYLVYLIPVLAFFLAPARPTPRPSRPAPAPRAAAAPASSATTSPDTESSPMSLPDRRLALLPALALVLTACGGSGDGEGGTSGDAAADTITVAASDDACDVDADEIAAGTHRFEVTNEGSKVTEFYVYAAGDRVMAEVENIAPGVSRPLLVELPAGEYEAVCKPGMVGDGIRSDLVVAGEAATLSEDESLARAGTDYQRYVQSQTAALLDRTTAFTQAVRTGDIPGAKALYPVARTYWERIEPVAESFGDLDPLIDGREGDQEEGQDFTGFHRLEKALWETGDISDMGPYADDLLANVQEIADRAGEVTLDPLRLANGAKALLDEVATGKITGEENRYSGVDLWDFAANLEGSQAAVQALRPYLKEANPGLVAEIDERFTETDAELGRYRAGDGWMLYDRLGQEQLKGLSDSITALTESVSKVAAVVADR